MKRSLKHIIWLFTLGLIPQLAFADNAVSNGSFPIPILNSFTPTPGDWSVDFLRQIFGRVGNVLSNVPETIMGKLFGVFNAAMLGLVAIIIIYVIVKIIMDACVLGHELRQKISHWVAIRVTIGTALLVPFKGGYSVIQVIIMWAVMQGIGLADTTWVTAVNFIKNGGGIHATNQHTVDAEKIRPELIDTAQASDAPKDANNEKAGAVDVLRSMVSMRIVEQAIQDKQEAKKQDIINHPYLYPKKGTTEYNELMHKLDQKVSLEPAYDEDHHFVIIPGISKEYMDDKDIQQFNGACGVYSWDVQSLKNDRKTNSATKEEIDQITNNYLQAKEAGLKQMILDLGPLARKLANQALDSSQNKGNGFEGNQVVNAAASYQSIIYPSASAVAALEVKDQRDTNKVHTDYGWAAAGRYYSLVYKSSPVLGFDSDYNKNNYQINVYTDKTYNGFPPASKGVADSDRQDSLRQLQDKLNKYDSSYVASLDEATKFVDDEIRSQSFGYLQKYNHNVSAGNEGSADLMPSLKTSSFFNESNKNKFHPKAYDAASLILKKHVDNAFDTWYDYMVNAKNEAKYDVDPLTKLQRMGESLVKEAYGAWKGIFTWYWITGAGIMTGFGLGGIATSLTGFAMAGNFMGLGAGLSSTGTTLAVFGGSLAQFLQSVLFFSLPLVLAITAPMFVTGAILSIYLPLVPFMFFIFGIISWLIFVIEAMAAAPLVALGVTHPEGHDLMGKAEQALMLWLSVFLRPMAMIIGLVAGMVLLYIAMQVLNLGFGGIIDDLFDPAHTGPSSAFTGLTVVLIYTFILVALVNQCFGLIYLIPEKIMRWIGLHPEGSDIPHLTESVKSGVQPFIQGTADGTGKVAAEGGKQTSNIAGGAVSGFSQRSTQGITGKINQEKDGD
jgi:hypothetical protein